MKGERIMPTYYDEKAKTWYVKLYYADYTGKKKQKMKRGFKLQRDAKEWEREFLAKQAGEPDMLFSSLCELYLEDMKSSNKQITHRTKKSHIEKWMVPYFGFKPVNDISATDIRKWQNELKSATSDRGTPLAPGYLYALFNELSGVFNYAMRFYGLSKNPCRTAGNMAGQRQKSMNFWTKEEFDQFIDTFQEGDPYRIAFLVLYYCGLRIGELKALTFEDIDLNAGTIRINKTYQVVKGTSIVTPPKTPKSNRIITLPPFMITEIKQHEEHFYSPSPDTRLFPTSQSPYFYRMKEHSELAGVKRIRLHDLRHSHASLLIELGFSALLVSERLGHENVSTTLNIYSHLFPSKQSEVAEKLEQLYHTDKNS